MGTHSLSESITLTAESDTIWTLASNQPWLVPDRTEGSGTATVRLDFTPAELPLGRHEATLALRSGEEETNIPVTLSVAPLALRMLFDAPGTPRAYAVSQTGGEWTSAMLLEIDASDGRILRSVSLPTISGLVWHADDGLLYISHYYSKYISVLAPGSLAWVRTLNFDSLAADTPFPQVDCPQRLYAGRRGRLLAEFASKIYGQPKVLRWLDSTTGKILATRKTEPEADIAFHASSGTGYNGGWFYLSTDTFSGAFPSDYVRVRDAQFIFFGPGTEPRLYRQGWISSPAGTPVEQSSDLLIAVSEDRSVQVGHHVAYVNGEIRALPPASQRVYNTVTKRIVSASETALMVSDPATLPTPAKVDARVAEVGDTWVRLVWDQPDATIPDYAPVKVEGRYASSGTWSQVSGAALAGTRSVVIDDQLPQSTRDFRISFYQNGYFNAPGEPVSVTFQIARPAQPYGCVGGSAEVGKPVSIGAQFIGKDLSFRVEGLPEGLVFDPAIQSVTGTATRPGRYSVTLVATNISGSAYAAFPLLVRADTSNAPTARYTGLIDSSEASLCGLWSATRSGQLLTGIYRTRSFTRAFRMTLSSNYQSGDAEFTLGGTRIGLRCDWDKDTDQLSLSAYLPQPYGLPLRAITDPATGWPSHWSTDHPHPYSGPYTALLIPGENASLPQGAGFLQLATNSAGVATIRGETSLGQIFTQTGDFSDFHTLPLFHSKGRLSLRGMVTAGTAPTAPAPLHGSLSWQIADNYKAPAYPDGFVQNLLIVGAPLPAVGKKLSSLAPLSNEENHAGLLLHADSPDGTSLSITQSLASGPDGFVVPKAGTAANPNRVAVKLNPKTGLVTGSAAVLNQAGTKAVRTLKFRGLLVRNPLGDDQDLVAGYFIAPDAHKNLRSGRLEITELPPVASE